MFSFFFSNVHVHKTVCNSKFSIKHHMLENINIDDPELNIDNNWGL